MPLNKDILGQALYNKAAEYNEVDLAPDAIEAARLAYWKGIAEVFINHVKTNAKLTVPGLGLTAPNGPVGGTSTTGTIQ